MNNSSNDGKPVKTLLSIDEELKLIKGAKEDQVTEPNNENIEEATENVVNKTKTKSPKQSKKKEPIKSSMWLYKKKCASYNKNYSITGFILEEGDHSHENSVQVRKIWFFLDQNV